MISKVIRYIYRHRRLPTLENLRKRRREVMPLPVQLQIEPTVACNFRCRYCPHGEYCRQTEGPARHMEMGLFRKIVDEVTALKEIKLQGLGEPLLCPHLREMMAYGHERGIVFNVISNGTMVSAKLPDLMPYLRRFVISFDTFDQARADRIKAGFDVAQCKANVAAMVAIKQERNPDCLVGITTVVSHENIAEVPDVLRFAREAGVDYAGFVAVENWNVPGEAAYPESAQYVAEAKEVVSMEQIRALYAIEGYVFQLGLQDFSPRKSNCYWMFDSAYVTFDGFVTPCCVRPNRHTFNFGNVASTRFEEVWNGEAAREFRNSHLQKTPNPICDRCPL